ncbi:MAG: hypothetical protein HOU81_27550 [Hamadaea sp.]|uniref:hypothetical protein n=1 Tax=Hamadaea sp. TaxID=2024425 RepID=UPI0017A46595|nr:hypothetical protein [Hamadaea sp.]NUR74583.1 hypothetical protein [Hamadaea sp.]NUT17706.1 hypothetical protein [Hamadaea sp.]
MAQDAESTSESFLDSVLESSRHKQPRSSDRRWPAPTAPSSADEPDAEDEAAEAYLPTVVGQRIRAALRGGQGRFGLLVAAMVGLTSLPTFVVMRTGLDDLAPTFREPAGVLLTEPAGPAPVKVRAHGQAPLPLQVEPARTQTRPHKTAVLAQPQRVRVAERANLAKPPAERPVAVTPPRRAAEPAAPIVVARTRPGQPFVRPVVVALPADLPAVADLPAIAGLPAVKLPPMGRAIVRRPVLRPVAASRSGLASRGLASRGLVSRTGGVTVERAVVDRPTHPAVDRPTRPLVDGAIHVTVDLGALSR